MGQKEKTVKYKEAKDLDLPVKWTMKETEIDEILQAYRDSQKEEEEVVEEPEEELPEEPKEEEAEQEEDEEVPEEEDLDEPEDFNEEVDVEFINGDEEEEEDEEEDQFFEAPKPLKKKPMVQPLKPTKKVSKPVAQKPIAIPEVIQARKRESVLKRYFPKKSKMKKNAP